MTKTKTKTKKKTMRHLLLPAAALLLAGCGDGVYALPDNAPMLEQETYVSETDKDDEYNSILYGGRQYVCYGTINGRFGDGAVGTCVGYTDGDTNERVCSLKDTDDYILQKYVGGFMEQPMLYRAIDTKGKEIYTPPYIESLDYDVWNNESAKEGRS